MSAWTQPKAEIDSLRAEIERLKEENKNLWNDYKSRADAAVSRQADNERLRAVLEQINRETANSNLNYCDACGEVNVIARAALEGKG